MSEQQSDPTALVDGVLAAATHLEPELEEALAEHHLSRPSFQVLSALLDADDRRSVTVTLTDGGRELVEAARPAYTQAAERLAAGLSEDARASFAEQLDGWLGFFEPDDGVAPRLGVAVAPAAVASRMRRAVGLPDRHGILVLKVKRSSAAADAGLARGDLVTGAGGADVRTIGDLHRAVRHARGTLALDVVRGVEERSVEVALSRPS